MNSLAEDRSPEFATAQTAAASNGSRRVSVQIADAARLAGLRSHWTDLLGRAASPNVFMDPALVDVARKNTMAAKAST